MQSPLAGLRVVEFTHMVMGPACGLVFAWNFTPQTTTQDRTELLLSAIASFEQAIALDPENDDAKYNLQLLLQRGSGLLPTEAAAGKNPTAGGRGSRGAGAGAPGSGY